MGLLHSMPLSSLRAVAVGCAALALGLLARAFQDRLVRRTYDLVARKLAVRRARLRYLRAPLSEHTVVAAELGLVVCAAACTLRGAWAGAAISVVPLCVLGPALELAVSRRTQRIEDQLDHWLCGLAASLRVAPALGQALTYSCNLVTAPLRDELVTVTEELALGVAVDEGLQRMAQRIGSRTVHSAIGALRVGRNTGGQLPELLERSAGVLREMARLEGVFRTKTAEGRAQASVVSVMPFALIALLHAVDPAFIAPLFSSTRGHLLLGATGLLWVAQLFVARRILHVDY